MKTIILSFITAALCVLTSAPRAAAATPVERYQLKTGDFTRLKVIDGINVDYIASADSAGIAVFDATAAQASTIGFATKGDELTISLTVNDVDARNRPTVRVYSNGLTSVENDGDSLVRVISPLSCPVFSAKQVGNGRTVVKDIDAQKLRAQLATGNGTVIINGKADEALLKLTGTGVIQADNLRANTVKVSAFGTGSVGCRPLNELKINGMGSTRIYYHGTPEVKNRAVGVKTERLTD